MTTLGQKRSTSTKEDFINAIDALFLKLELAYHYQFYKVFGTDEKLKEGITNFSKAIEKLEIQLRDRLCLIENKTNVPLSV